MISWKNNTGIIAQEIGSLTTMASTCSITTPGDLYTVVYDDSISLTTTSFNDLYCTKEFEDKFPNWGDFQNMCKEYPSLSRVFSQLILIYNLCKDDWTSKK